MKTLLTPLLYLTTLTAFSQAPFTAPDNIGAGNCLEFDGVDDQVNCGDINSGTFDDINNELTIEAWVFPNAFTAPNSQICSKYNTSIGSPNKSFALEVGGTGILTFAAYNPSGNDRLLEQTVNPALVIGEWQHVAISVNLTTQQIILFVNGSVSTSNLSLVGTPPSVFTNDNASFLIGDAIVATGNHRSWNGEIDDVRIWNVARTQAQIRDNMCHQLTGTETGLVGYWNMNEGAGNTVNDLTPNANHGTRQ